VPFFILHRNENNAGNNARTPRKKKSTKEGWTMLDLSMILERPEPELEVGNSLRTDEWLTAGKVSGVCPFMMTNQMCQEL
jgi:hypothetical protein